jgi:hypothetical protein
LQAEDARSEDALPEMVRQQVAALLRCVTFTQDGEDVRVSGFRFLDRPEVEYAVGLSLSDAQEESGEALGAAEPRPEQGPLGPSVSCDP